MKTILVVNLILCFLTVNFRLSKVVANVNVDILIGRIPPVESKHFHLVACLCALDILWSFHAVCQMVVIIT